MTQLFSKPIRTRYGWRVTAMANHRDESDSRNAENSAVFVGWSSVSAKRATRDALHQVNQYFKRRK